MAERIQTDAGRMTGLTDADGLGDVATRGLGWRTLAVSTACSGLAIGILAYGNFAPLPPVALALAGLALLASVGRIVFGFARQRDLISLAGKDPLTGLVNHREFHLSLAHHIEVSTRAESGRPFSVAVFDLDGLKAVNDLRGHAEGDRVLREVAGVIASTCRSADVVARIRGDEFAVILPRANAAHAAKVINRVKAAVERLDEGISLSYGISEWPGDGPDKEMLLLRADLALYASTHERDPDGAPAPDPAAGDDASPGHGSTAASAPAPAPDQRELERAQLRAYALDVRESYARELRRVQQLEQSYLDTVLALAATVSAKDDYTGGHIHRVRSLGLMLARALVPEDAEDPQLAYGFLLHDLGKLEVPDQILTKPDKLTAQEWEVMRRHPRAGVEILSNVPFLDRALEVVLHHHERWDGGGYPDGLAGEAIPQWARIFAIADTVDAMTSDRPYRAGLPLDTAIEELERASGSQFDPACVAAFRTLDCDEVKKVIAVVSPAMAPITAR